MYPQSIACLRPSTLVVPPCRWDRLSSTFIPSLMSLVVPSRRSQRRLFSPLAASLVSLVVPISRRSFLSLATSLMPFVVPVGGGNFFSLTPSLVPLLPLVAVANQLVDLGRDVVERELRAVSRRSRSSEPNVAKVCDDLVDAVPDLDGSYEDGGRVELPSVSKWP